MSVSDPVSESSRRQNKKLKENVIHQKRLIESLKGGGVTSDDASAYPASGGVLLSSNDAITFNAGSEESLVNMINLFIDSLAKKAELHKQDKVFLTSFLSSYVKDAEL